VGKTICNILDYLDKNHCLKSIKELWETYFTI
jgi:hypothetical protein